MPVVECAAPERQYRESKITFPPGQAADRSGGSEANFIIVSLQLFEICCEQRENLTNGISAVPLGKQWQTTEVWSVSATKS